VRVLVITNMYPTSATPAEGHFIRDQVESIRAVGIDIDLLHIDRVTEGTGAYRHVRSRTRRAVSTHRPDVVHVTYGGVLAHQALHGARGTPFVVSFCGSDLLGNEPGSIFRRAVAKIGVLASRRTAVSADAIIVKSDNLRSALPRHVEDERVHVLPNGVSITLFRPLDQATCRARIGWVGPGPHLMFGGRPRDPKQPELAQEAVQLLRRDHPGAELHVPDGVARDLMPIWLNAADALVLTSRHEGSPNIVKEALACETPVVSVPVGDVPLRIADVADCRLVGWSPNEIAMGIADVLTTPALGGARSTLSDLSLEGVARQVIAVYDQAIELQHLARGPGS
jgi:glycosyltransferase involved in cell wall biosynthesis